MDNNRCAWERVEMARNQKRPTSSYFIENLFENFIELHGDELFGDDAAIIAGIGMLDGTPVTIIGQEKGRDTNERILRNFGSPHPEGYRKSLRLMKQAEKFGRPIVCFIDTQGAYCGIGAEERGQGSAIAHNLMEMSGLKVPIISIIIGEGGSGGALALAVADKVAVMENAVYSILTPEGFATILWKDSSRAKEAADVMKLTAHELKKMGVIDDVLPEPEGGMQIDPEAASSTIKKYISENISELLTKDPEKLIEERYKKYRNMAKP